MSQNNSFEYSGRLGKLPPYLFVEVDKMKQKAIDEGVDIINLGVGDPDTPTPEAIRNKLKEAIEDADNHQYPMGKGKKSFRAGVRDFFRMRFGVELDPEKNIHPLIGSKEGIAHFPLAFIEPGDIVLVPEPAYPVYNSGTIFALGEPYFFSLLEENDFLPDFSSIPEDVLRKAKMIFLNYPNNPTGAEASMEFFRDAVRIAKKYNIIIAHDAAYSEMYYAEPPASIFEVEGAMDVAVEFHSLSKTFSMTGWRIGWACGGEKLISGLASIKDNIDSGVFGAVQDAGLYALENYDELTREPREIYKERLKIMKEGLKKLSWRPLETNATFYVWTKPPVDITSADAVKKIISGAGIVCTPGSGFGPSGEGYVRFALTRDAERLKEALRRLGELEWE